MIAAAFCSSAAVVAVIVECILQSILDWHAAADLQGSNMVFVTCMLPHSM